MRKHSFRHRGETEESLRAYGGDDAVSHRHRSPAMERIFLRRGDMTTPCGGVYGTDDDRMEL